MFRSITTAFKQIRRTPYQALGAILVLTLTFFATAAFALISGGFYLIFQHFEEAPQVIAFFDKGQDLSEAELQKIEQKLKAQVPLASFKYVSTKEAEKIYKEKNSNDPLLNELVDYKILPPSVEVSTEQVADLTRVKEMLEAEPLVKDLAFYEDVVNQLTLWLTNIRVLGVGIIGFLATMSVLILMIIIGFKVKHKRNEIRVLRLLGASGWYIGGPFLMEGIIYGALGAALGWLASFTVLQYMTPHLLEWLGDILVLPVDLTILGMLLIIMVLTGMILGAFSSLLAVRRFVKI